MSANMSAKSDNDKIPADRWLNRRRMAWLALLSGLAFPVLMLHRDLSSIAGAFYLFVGSVVGAYIGFSTVDDKWQTGR
jgi:hypothetical protein